MATSEEVKFFKDNGYLILEDFLTAEQCDALRQECWQLVEDMNPAEHHCVFDTKDNKQMKDDYFLTSGDKIRYFFEEGALNDKGELQVDKQRSLNKIGHALHALSPEFRKITFSEKIKNLVRNVGLEDPAVVQSMYIFKQPHIGGEVTPHQDSWFLHTTPFKLIGIWIALEDATLENGCLSFIPGSHTHGIDKNRRMVRNPDPEGPCLTFTADMPQYDDSKYVDGPVKKGSLVLIHGEVVHKSRPNVSENSRHIYTFHIIDRKDSVYSKDNWLQPTEALPFPSLYTFQ